MSTVPYIFASQVGNIALSELDDNFANVKANVDYAVSAGTAGTVTASSQPNITSLGTLTSVSSTGSITGGNLITTGNIILPDGSDSPDSGMLVSANGYPTIYAYGSDMHGGPELNYSNADALDNFYSSSVYRNTMYLNGQGLYVGINENGAAGTAQNSLVFDFLGNVSATGNLNVVGNITGGNILTGGIISATGNISTTGNVFGNYATISTTINATNHIGQVVSVSGNITAGNINTSGRANAVSFVGNVVSVGGNITGGNILTGGIISAAGNVRGNGFYSVSTYGGAYSDGIVVDYTTGNGRISVGTSDGLNIYNGSTVAGNLIASFNTSGSLQILAGTAVPAGGTAGAGLKMSSTANLGIFFGSGAPTLSAAQGSLYINTTGNSTSTRMYVNTNGSTGWTNVTTGA